MSKKMDVEDSDVDSMVARQARRLRMYGDFLIALDAQEGDSHDSGSLGELGGLLYGEARRLEFLRPLIPKATGLLRVVEQIELGKK